MRENDILNDPNTSDWLRNALQSALKQDAVRVANDVETLRIVLQTRLDEMPAAGGDAARAPGGYPDRWLPKQAG